MEELPGGDCVTRAELVAAMRKVGACGIHVTGPAALERLADELAEAAEAGKVSG